MGMIKDMIHAIRRPLAISAHGAIIGVAYVFSYYLRFDLHLPEEYIPLIARTMIPLIAIKGIIFFYFGLYHGLWRYVGMDDLWKILKANVAGTAAFALFVAFFYRMEGFPRSVFFIDMFLCAGIIGGVRFLSRGYREIFRPMNGGNEEKALIVGAGAAGIMILAELKKNLGIDVVGFIDDDTSKKGMIIHGKSILGGKESIREHVRKLGIKIIIIAIPSAPGNIIRDIIASCSLPDVKVKIVPGMYKILKGELEVKVRDVAPEDLLGRESVEISEIEIREYVGGKTVLITGAAGSIGSEITRQVSQFSPRMVVLVDHNENDLYFLERELRKNYNFAIKVIAADFKDISVLKYSFSMFRPQIVFHAAAFKHVPLMEENPSSAVKNNIVGTRNIVYAASHYKVERFVLISSDKAVNATSVMGASKRIAEMILQAKSKKSRTRFMAVRFGNVLGSQGSVVPLFKKQIEAEGKLTVTHPDAKRFFMSVKEAVQLVLQAGAIGKGGEIFVLEMGEQINIVELAKSLIQLSGLRPEDIPIEFIGLRPGEKMYEETILDAEKDRATKHEKIFITQPSHFDPRIVMLQVKELQRLADRMEGDKIIRKIAEMVPTYKNRTG